MRKELDDALCAKFPNIFKDRNADMRTTAMCWGFDCGDGWYSIINKLCTDIQKHLDENPKVEQVVATQVKEKFGTLRFYICGGDNTIDDMIMEAEQESARTCEVCGKPGSLETKGWMTVRCDDCRKSIDE